MSATVNVLCYKSKVLSNGESPLMLRICKDGKKKYKSLRISIKSIYWDYEKGKLKRNYPNYNKIHLLITKQLNDATIYFIVPTVLQLTEQTNNYTKPLEQSKYIVAQNSFGQCLGHLKSAYRLTRNFYKGMAGDTVNVLLAAAAYNFKRVMKTLGNLIQKNPRDTVHLQYLTERGF